MSGSRPTVVDIVAREYTGTAGRARLARKCPSGVDAERLLQAYVDTCKHGKAAAKLLEATPESHRRAMDACIRLGLWPGPHKHVYVIPRWNKHANGENQGGQEANAELGYPGMIAILKRQGGVSAVESVLVYDGDDFSLSRSGARTHLHHVETLPRASSKIVGCYARAFFVDGSAQVELMDRDQIDKIRRDHAKNSPAWSSHWGEMARKTVIRRLAKYVGTDEMIGAAFALVDSLESRLESRLEKARDVTPGKHAGNVAGLLEGAASYVEAPAVEVEPATEEA